jgi:hypothetical protein
MAETRSIGNGAQVDENLRKNSRLITNQLLYQLSYVGAFCVGK